ncbi:PdaC/SigV domain-containing protein [Ornithinibacillus scapharcae]|uniref:PdaC/SigV domain-containing protein n=1 Tax=Ornithinibacillus scapharcae TaxID=1147159 RepID=UPI000225B643
MPTFPVQIIPLSVSAGLQKNVYYPQVIHMQNQLLEKSINQAIINETQALINLQVADMPSSVVEMLGTFELKNNQREVLSLSLTNYTYHDKAAHGMTYIKSLNFDLLAKKKLDLKDLFKQTW